MHFVMAAFAEIEKLFSENNLSNEAAINIRMAMYRAQYSMRKPFLLDQKLNGILKAASNIENLRYPFPERDNIQGILTKLSTWK